MKWFRKHFLGGILTLIPLLVVLFFLQMGLGWLHGIYAWIPDLFKPTEPVSRFLFFLACASVILCAIAALGYVSKLYFGQKILRWLGHLISKIPIVGTIYSSLTQLIETLTKGGGKQFRRVVFIQFPHPGIRAVAFVTGPSKLEGLPKGYLNVFVPAVPNPTSGFHLLVPEKEVVESDLTVEQAFQLILSLGLAPPRT